MLQEYCYTIAVDAIGTYKTFFTRRIAKFKQNFEVLGTIWAYSEKEAIDIIERGLALIENKTDGNPCFYPRSIFGDIGNIWSDNCYDVNRVQAVSVRYSISKISASDPRKWSAKTVYERMTIPQIKEVFGCECPLLKGVTK